MKYRAIMFIFLFLIVWCGRIGAEQDTLEKLRARDWDIWLGEGGYDIALMGEDAAPFLVSVLTDENEDARWHAHYLLDRYYADPSILPVLTYLFIDSTDKSIRSNAIDLIASIDAEYAKALIGNYLDDPNIQDTVVSLLTGLRDERAVPLLVERLKVKEKRNHAAYALAGFKDKRALPILLEMLDDPTTESGTLDAVFKSLANIADEQTMPRLFNYVNGQRRISSGIIDALSESEMPSILALLKTIEQTDIDQSSYKWQRILEVFRHQNNPELIPYFEKAYLNANNSLLLSEIPYALGKMGKKGLESLLKIAQQKPTVAAFRTLATYNTDEAIETVISYAMDESCPFRTEAIQALFQYTGLWEDKLSKHIMKLLADVSPREELLIVENLLEFGDSWKAEIFKHLTQLLVETESEATILTIDLIRRKNLAVMTPALENLIQNAKGSALHAAQMVYDILHDRPPLKLTIEMDQQQYDYGHPITLTYRITNVSEYPIYLALYKSLASGYVRVKIQQPDGTWAQYRGPIASLLGLRFDDIQTLQPNDEITETTQILDYYDLLQSGFYTVELQISPGLEGVILEDKPHPNKQERQCCLTWSDTLHSHKDLFHINPILPAKLNEMIASIDPEVINKENEEEIIETCRQLIENRSPEGIAALKKLALMDTESPDDFRHYIKRSAQRFLIDKFLDPELVSTWIKTFNIGYNIHTRIKVLRASEDARAIEPLRRITFGLNNANNSTRAALALQQLGDESGVKWLRKIAFRKLRHWKENERNRGAAILARLESPNEPIYYRPHDLRNPWFYAKNYGQSIDWSMIHEKAATPDGLKKLLQHKNPIIQRSAAYELAHLGDKTGVHLIQQDLYANESATRLHARKTLTHLKQKVSTGTIN